MAKKGLGRGLGALLDAGAVVETTTENEKDVTRNTRIIDAFVTNRLFGFPIFLFIMFAIFWATFEVGAYPMH